MLELRETWGANYDDERLTCVKRPCHISYKDMDVHEYLIKLVS